MTNIKNKNSSSTKQHRTPLVQRPWFIVTVVIITLVIITALIIAFVNSRPQEEGTTEQKPTASPSQSESQDQPKTDSESPSKEERPEDKVIQFEGEDPNDLEEITGVVTYRNVENGTLIIDTSIDQYLTNGGTCTLTLQGQQTGHVTTVENAAHADISTSYCETYKIPTSDLPADYYDIKILVLSNGKKGTIKDGVQL